MMLMMLIIKLTMMAMLTTAVMLKMVLLVTEYIGWSNDEMKMVTKMMAMVVMMMLLLVTECMGWSSDVCTRTVPPPIHWSGQSEVAEHETFTRKIKKNQKR